MPIWKDSTNYNAWTFSLWAPPEVTGLPGWTVEGLSKEEIIARVSTLKNHPDEYIAYHSQLICRNSDLNYQGYAWNSTGSTYQDRIAALWHVIEAYISLLGIQHIPTMDSPESWYIELAYEQGSPGTSDITVAPLDTPTEIFSDPVTGIGHPASIIALPESEQVLIAGTTIQGARTEPPAITSATVPASAPAKNMSGLLKLALLGGGAYLGYRFLKEQKVIT